MRYWKIIFISVFVTISTRSEETAMDSKIKMSAWNEFTHGSDKSLVALNQMLTSGKMDDKIRFSKLVCKKGNGNFCYLAGMYLEDRNPKEAIEYYKKNCAIKKMIMDAWEP